MTRMIERLRDDSATQIVEFALSLPLLVLLVVAATGLWCFARAERNFTDTV